MSTRREKRRAYRRETPLRDRLVGLHWRIRHRAYNRYADLRARLSGYCNDKPWRAPSRGGYMHWRCALERGHVGLHRYNNYVWTPDGRTSYLPVSNPPRQPWDRNGTPTLRQSRLMDRWHAEQRELRRREREAA